MGQDTASALLGVDGVRVVEVEQDDDGRVRVWTVTEDPAAAVCPDCGTRSGRVHEHVLTRPRDLPRGPDPVEWVWLKRRWKCVNPGCARARFTEVVGQVPARARVSGRLREHAAALVGELGATVSAAAGVCGLSWPSTHQALSDHADSVLSTALGPVSALGIDETCRGRRRLARDPDTGGWVVAADRWHTGFVDLSADQGLLGQVQGRTADDAAYWLPPDRARLGPAGADRGHRPAAASTPPRHAGCCRTLLLPWIRSTWSSWPSRWWATCADASCARSTTAAAGPEIRSTG